MLAKLSLITIIVLMTSCLQSQNNTLQTEMSQAPAVSAAVNRTEVIDYAKQYLGVTYKNGGTDPLTGFDCSGFVHFVFKKFNINLPTSSGGYQSLGTALKPEDFKIGDILVFYGYLDSNHIGHVGIICEANGMKSRFIHASSGKAYGVTISDLGSDMYTRRFYKCIDVIH